MGCQRGAKSFSQASGPGCGRHCGAAWRTPWAFPSLKGGEGGRGCLTASSITFHTNKDTLFSSLRNKGPTGLCGDTPDAQTLLGQPPLRFLSLTPFPRWEPCQILAVWLDNSWPSPPGQEAGQDPVTGAEIHRPIHPQVPAPCSTSFLPGPLTRDAGRRQARAMCIIIYVTCQGRLIVTLHLTDHSDRQMRHRSECTT